MNVIRQPAFADAATSRRPLGGPAAAAAADAVEAARQLGHDLHVRTLLPPQPAWPAAVREGYAAAAARGLHRHGGDRFERKWLQLRLGAWLRGRPVADDVTPHTLHQIDLAACPVTRRPLTHGTQADTDWSIDRLNNDGAYALGNLAVMSVRANAAKGALSFAQVHARAAAGDASADGLAGGEWLRLAALMLGPAFALRPGEAPWLPLCAPLPVRAVRLPVQQLQGLFAVEARRAAGRNQLVRSFRPACSNEAATVRLQRLADAVHDGLKQLPPGAEIWDVWLLPPVMPALLEWRDALGARGWQLAAQIACAATGGRRVGGASLAPWCLSSQGYRSPAGA